MSITIEIEDFYPYSYQPIVRYGGDYPPHPIIEPILAKNLKQYEETLRQFAELSSDFLKISRDFDASQPHAPYWINGFFPGLDSITLYGIISTQKPNIFCEIGSGNSTKFAVAAKAAHSPNTKIISIDPEPRAEVDQICDTMIRKPLQECDLSIFQSLQAGDILFLDGSHRTLQNSDATIFFLEIFPLLKSGVIVQVHDIFWPFDYPLAWSKRMYSEQYLLGALLIYAQDKIDVLLPNAYISHYQKLTAIFHEIWNAPALEGIETHGASFWFTKKEP